MKTLELENCGLQEMNVSEMKSVDGGLLLALAIVAVAFLAVDYLQDGKIDGKIFF